MEQICTSEWKIHSLITTAWKKKLRATGKFANGKIYKNANFSHIHYYKHHHLTDSNTLNLKKKKQKQHLMI